jgi:hypothetical protein
MALLIACLWPVQYWAGMALLPLSHNVIGTGGYDGMIAQFLQRNCSAGVNKQVT